MEIDFTLENIEEAARKFLDHTGSDTIFAFDGAMGAGKTTLIAEICRLLGVDSYYGSPTFAILNEYATKTGQPIYHFDFYRLDDPHEALDIGAEDYLYSGNYCFIEWPDRLGNLLPEECRRVSITVNPDGSRKLIF